MLEDKLEKQVQSDDAKFKVGPFKDISLNFSIAS